MIANQKELFQFLDHLFKPFGFIKKKDTWYLHTPECICFFSIGKSPFAGRYDHVMGCFVKAINENIEEFPKFYKKNLGFNLAEFIGKEEVRRMFDLENMNFEKDEREKRIKKIIEEFAIPFLADISSEEGIKTAIKKYANLKYNVDIELQEYLQIKVH